MNHTVVAERIRAAGFRATTPRMALLSLLQKSSKPLTIQEIVERLKRAGVDQVTVYRMLDAFKKTGLVREVHLLGDRSRYEVADDEHDHHHIVCTKCHKIEDFTGCEAEQVGKVALRHSKSFSRITGHSFDLYGVCKACA